MAETLTKDVVIPSTPKALEREPLVLNRRPIGWISDQISSIAEGKTPTWWWALFIPSVLITGVCFAMIVYLMSTGVGVWGLMVPVAWAWDITTAIVARRRTPGCAESASLLQGRRIFNPPFPPACSRLRFLSPSQSPPAFFRPPASSGFFCKDAGAVAYPQCPVASRPRLPEMA